MQDTYQVLYAAIQNKKTVSAFYQGYQREMCPHALGTKNSRPQCLFFQFAGGSSSGLPAGGMWRCVPVEGINIVRVYDGPWYTGDGHSKEQTCVGNVDIEIIY
jgi:hypothetical protein